VFRGSLAFVVTNDSYDAPRPFDRINAEGKPAADGIAMRVVTLGNRLIYDRDFAGVGRICSINGAARDG
jgi:hypothetical protein